MPADASSVTCPHYSNFSQAVGTAGLLDTHLFATEMLIELARGISEQLGCRLSATWDRRRGCVDSEVGPAVRIRFPPPGSLQTLGPARDEQFRNPVHGVSLSKDGLVYVSDRHR